MKRKYERLKELEKMKARFDSFYKDYKAHPFVVFSSIKARRDTFYNQTSESKRVHGLPQILDVPDDIGINEMVVSAINEQYDKVVLEFNKLLSE